MEKIKKGVRLDHISKIYQDPYVLSAIGISADEELT